MLAVDDGRKLVVNAHYKKGPLHGEIVDLDVVLLIVRTKVFLPLVEFVDRAIVE